MVTLRKASPILALSLLPLSCCVPKPAVIRYPSVAPPGPISISALHAARGELETAEATGICGAQRAYVLESYVLRKLRINDRDDNALLKTIRGEVWLELASEYERQRGDGDRALDMANQLFSEAAHELDEFVPAHLGLAEVARRKGLADEGLEHIDHAATLARMLYDLAPTKGETPPEQGLFEMMGWVTRVEPPTGNAERFDELMAWLSAYDRWTDATNFGDGAPHDPAPDVSEVLARLRAAVLVALASNAQLAGPQGDGVANDAFDLSYRVAPDYLPGRLAWADWALRKARAGEVSREFQQWLSIGRNDERGILYTTRVRLIAARADAILYGETHDPIYRQRALNVCEELLNNNQNFAPAYLEVARIAAGEDNPDLAKVEEYLGYATVGAGCVDPEEINEVRSLVRSHSGG